MERRPKHALPKGIPMYNYSGQRSYEHGVILRPSFSLPFGGAEIWCASLDGLGAQTALLHRRLDEDFLLLRRPSLPGLVALHLADTAVNSDDAKKIAAGLCALGRPLRRVAFIDLGHSARLIKASLKQHAPSFSFGFFSDYEKAKQWLTDPGR